MNEDRTAKRAWRWQKRLSPEHPEWFAPKDVVRIVRSGEALIVDDVMDDGRLLVRRGVGSIRSHRIRKGDRIFIVANLTPPEWDFA